MPELIIPVWFEKYFLKLYAFIVPMIKLDNQLFRRLADFAQRGLMNYTEQEKIRVLKTAEEIKKMALDKENYIILEKKPTLILLKKDKSVIYVLKEKTKEDIIKSIQKAL